MALSRTQVDKLGDRLRKSVEISNDDLTKLQEYIDEHAAAQVEVAERLRGDVVIQTGTALATRWEQIYGPDEERVRVLAEPTRTVTATITLEPTSRLKTRDTTVEKLHRIPRLSTIHDIAGVRVVLARGRLQQDAVVHGIMDLVPGATKVDRRAEPSFGYRAVHVIVEINGRYVEVQVRTHLQDLWAQMFERLADELGRQIRYGEPPGDADKALGDGGSVTRQGLVDIAMELADRIDEAEESAARAEALEMLHRISVASKDLAGATSSETEAAVTNRVTEFRRLADDRLAGVEQLVRTLHGIVSAGFSG